MVTCLLRPCFGEVPASIVLMSSLYEQCSYNASGNVIRGGVIFRASSTDPEDPSVLKATEWYMYKDWLFPKVVIAG